MDEVYENGPIRIAKAKRGVEFIYSVTLADFAQLVLDQYAFDSLMELMVAFNEESDIAAIRLHEEILQEQLDFEIQEGEYG